MSAEGVALLAMTATCQAEQAARAGLRTGQGPTALPLLIASTRRWQRRQTTSTMLVLGYQSGNWVTAISTTPAPTLRVACPFPTVSSISRQSPGTNRRRSPSLASTSISPERNEHLRARRRMPVAKPAPGRGKEHEARGGKGW